MIKKLIFAILILCNPCQFLRAQNTKMVTSYDVATFSGGSFWTLQYDFNQLGGVISTTVGYTGGLEVTPTYKEVSQGQTGHVEAIQVVFDPKRISYASLIDYYFHNIDPTRNDGQFCDKGKQYRPIIFYHNAEQKQIAENYKKKLIQSERFTQIDVAILPEIAFYPAEDSHQDYYKKNPISYKFYRLGCRKEKRLRELWQN